MVTSTSALPGTIITNLPPATSISGSELIPLVQGGTTKYGTAGQIAGSLQTAVTNASFVLTSSAPAVLPNARAITASSPITVVDGGAGTTLTIGLATTALTSNSTAPFIMASSGSGFSGARALTAQAGVTTVADGGASSNFVVGIATNGIGNVQFRQSAGLSVVGVTAVASGNVADISGTADQILRISSAGTGLAFGAINLASSQAVGNVLTVPNGGTGSSAFTAYQVITGGTVSSAPLQTVTAGTSGYVLTYGTSNTLPTWQASPTGTVTTSIQNYAAYYSSNGNSVTGSSNLTVWSSLGRIGINAATIFTPQSLLDISNNISSVALPAPLSGTTVRLSGTDGTTTRFSIDTFGALGSYSYRRANGTNAAKTPLSSGDSIGSFGWAGYDNSSNYSGVQASIAGVAGEAWTATNHGLYIAFTVTSTGSVTPLEAMRIQPSGGVSIGNGVVTTDPGAGALITSSNVLVGGKLGVGFETNPQYYCVINANSGKAAGATAPSGITPSFYGISANGNGSDFILETYRTGGGGNILSMFARGTSTTPVVPNSSDQLGFYQGVGWDGTQFNIATGSGFRIATTETWSTSANGSQLEFWATQTATLTRSRVGTLTGFANMAINGSYASKVAVTLTSTTAASGTVGNSDAAIIINSTTTPFTLTLPTAATFSGRWLNVKNVTATAVNSTGANIQPLGSTVASSTILGAVAGRWAMLQSNGTNWEIMAAN